MAELTYAIDIFALREVMLNNFLGHGDSGLVHSVQYFLRCYQLRNFGYSPCELSTVVLLVLTMLIFISVRLAKQIIISHKFYDFVILNQLSYGKFLLKRRPKLIEMIFSLPQASHLNRYEGTTVGQRKCWLTLASANSPVATLYDSLLVKP